jgi:hypothetical protein
VFLGLGSTLIYYIPNQLRPIFSLCEPINPLGKDTIPLGLSINTDSRIVCNINMIYCSLIHVTYSFSLWESPSFCEPGFLIIFFTNDPKIMDKGIALRIVDLGFLYFSLCLGFPKRDHFKNLIKRIFWHGNFQFTLSWNLSTRLASRLESPQQNSNCECKCMLVI